MAGQYAMRPVCVPGDIAITGLSGRLPESSNIEEFSDNLFKGVDMVTDEPRHWPNGHYDLPSRFGKIKQADMENFDHQFFSVHQKQAECMDPQLRLLLETAHEAIMDAAQIQEQIIQFQSLRHNAGFNPQDIRGSRTGVYIGTSNSEVDQYWCKDGNRVNGYGPTGCSRSMFANRLSFAFDFNGPSLTIDTACSASLYAMQLAFEDMRSGRCDSAIVGGCNLILNPYYSLQLKRLGMLNAEGMCKAFDEAGNGYVRSESCVVIFMQLAKDARRVYASVLNARSNTDGYKEKGVTYPSGAMQLRLIRETYADIGLNPAEVVYVEAHGTGTKIGDPVEVKSITDFFCCEDRKAPLLIGSVKTNMGHSEAASGICAIAKMLIAMEAGIIPGNLHYKSVNPDLHGIVDGRLKVVDRNTKWNGGIIGLSSYGFGGANAHVILKSNPKTKVLVASGLDSVPRLVVVSGRTKQSVEVLLDDAETHKEDEEYLGLINEIHVNSIPLHHHRGYAVIGNGETHREVCELLDKNRPVWYIYAGIGSQWVGMARDLMQVEVFKNSILKCAEALRPEGIDLIDVITTKDEKILANILNSFISIAAIQVALTDLLTNLGIRPNGIVGHSVGEIGCAYADGCFTAEQTVLASYWRGRSVIDAKMIPGAMAAVGLPLEECNKRLPIGVFTACHNSPDNITISGPADLVNNFVTTLTSEGIFAKIVDTAGIAFHSKYIDKAGHILLKSLEGLIPNPIERTSRWVSSSISESDWTTQLARKSSAAYHVNNLLSTVLFHEAVQHIPKNAICIEIAPTGLLHGILKRSLGSEVAHISLSKRGHVNNLKYLLSNVGQLYAAGAQPIVSFLSGPISYPVSRGTPMLNSKICWDHSQKMFVPNMFIDSECNEIVIDVDLSKDIYSYLNGYIIDGRLLFPATGYLILAWHSFAKSKNSSIEKTPVILENVVFHQPITMTRDGSVKFSFKFLDGSGRFEICENGNLIVSGLISIPEDIICAQLQLNTIPADASDIHLTSKDVYKELRLRGYDYDGILQGVVSSDSNAVTGKLHWNDNWISYLDTMLQINFLGKHQRGLYLPNSIDRLVINPVKHLEIIAQTKDVPVYRYSKINVTQSGGVEIRGLQTSLETRRTIIQSGHIMESYQFVSSVGREAIPRAHAITVSVQIVIENSSGAMKLKVADFVGDLSYENTMAATIQSIIENEPMLVSDVTIATIQLIESYIHKDGTSEISVVNKDITKGEIEQNCHLVSAYDVTTNIQADTILKNLIASIKEGGFILLEESTVGFNEAAAMKLFNDNGLARVSVQLTSGKIYFLLRGKVDIGFRNKQIVVVTEKSFNWLGELKEALAAAEQENRYVYVVSQGEELFGALGFIKCIKYDAGGKFVRLVYIPDVDLEKFSFNGNVYTEQLSQDLVFQVYRKGSWGTYRHLHLENIRTVPVEHAYVNTPVKGDFSSLKWIEGPLPRIFATEDLCTVYYAPINFRDVMIASGKMAVDTVPGNLANRECTLGVEFAGRDSTGKRIMALVEARALATTCLANRSIMWEVPSNWTLEQSSTIPAAYSMAYFALVIRGRMRKGETILIHAGSRSYGLAAISVALSYGLTVYTTVGSNEKRAYLKKTFPELTEAHIVSSRSTSLEQHIMSETNKRGVDLVLSSFNGEVELASLPCLGLNGRFLQIGKAAMNKNTKIGMSILLKNTIVPGILLDSGIFGNVEVMEEIVRLVSEGIKSGAVRPLPVTIYNDNQLEEAFRAVASSKHIGKVVIRVRQEEEPGFNTNTLNVSLMPSIPRTYMHKEKSYIIVGGLGGIGLELANWMVMRGASKLVLTSRSGVKTGYQAMMIHRWKELGVSVLVDTNDATTAEGANKLLFVSNRLGPVGGIFNLAVILRDRLFENATEADFSAVCLPKVEVTKQLDMASRKLCKELDYFVCFSSTSCGRGHNGQTTYGLANSAMERICDRRKNDGFSGTAIQWGALGDTGVFIENLGKNDTVIGGLRPMRIPLLLASMDILLHQNHAVVSSIVLAEKRKVDLSGDGSLAEVEAGRP